jgi:hypothetical protein
MFTEPVTVNVAGSARTFATLNLDGQKSTRRSEGFGASTFPVTLTIGHQDSKENPAAGGSVRTLIRAERDIIDAGTGLIKGHESAALTLVAPKGVSTAASLGELIQTLVSFLLAETDGTLSTDATVDTGVVGKLFLGEP